MAAKKKSPTVRVRGVNTRGWTTIAVSAADHTRLGELAYTYGRECGFRVTRGMVIGIALDRLVDLTTARVQEGLRSLHALKDR